MASQDNLRTATRIDIDTSQSPSHLLSIPLEILLQISRRLTTPEYGNLRRTCKAIEGTLLNAFAQEFFTKRQFMLTEFSLQALLDISKSRLSKYMNHVIIGMERPTNATYRIPPDHGSNYHMLQESIDHMTLLYTGQDVEMLTEAFSNLGNLGTVEMRDFNSRSRNRDYPQNEWKSYGVNTYERISGCKITTPGGYLSPHGLIGDQNNYLARTFLILLRALGKSGTTPNNFQVVLRHSSLCDATFSIPKYVESSIGPVLRNLKSLSLDLNSQAPPTYTTQVALNNHIIFSTDYQLLNFLSKLSLLEHLRLNFKRYSNSERSDVLSWLSKEAKTALTDSGTLSEGVPSFPVSVDFAHLRQLEIGMALVEPGVLLAVINKFRTTLRAISFHRLSLLEADSVKSENRVNLWAQFFRQLAKLDLKLDLINVFNLQQMQSQFRRLRRVTFKHSRQASTKRWAGTDTQSGLRDFIDEIVVARLEDDTDSGSNDEGDDYLDNDEDEEEEEEEQEEREGDGDDE